MHTCIHATKDDVNDGDDGDDDDDDDDDGDDDDVGVGDDDADDGVGEPIVMSFQALVTQIGPKVLSWFAHLPLTCG